MFFTGRFMCLRLTEVPILLTPVVTVIAFYQIDCTVAGTGIKCRRKQMSQFAIRIPGYSTGK